MTFTVSKASDWNFKETVVFTSLEELEQYQTDVGFALIINFKTSEILIYDDYIE